MRAVSSRPVMETSAAIAAIFYGVWEVRVARVISAYRATRAA